MANSDSIQIVCPTCLGSYNHIDTSSTKSGGGLPSFGRAVERGGIVSIVECENQGHVFIIGFGEHKGVINVYVREPLPGEVGRDISSGALGFLTLVGDQSIAYEWEVDADASFTEGLGARR